MPTTQDILDLAAHFRHVMTSVDASTPRPTHAAARPLTVGDTARAQFVIDCLLDHLFGPGTVRSIMVPQEDLREAVRAACVVHGHVAAMLRAATTQQRDQQASAMARMRALRADAALQLRGYDD